MADATVSRFGQVNGAGSATALFLKVFAGEVLTAFAEANIMMPLHMTRSITSGKSATFPASWKAAAAYHTPGTEIVGAVIKANERVINIDNLLIAHAFIATIDEAMNHYDVRSDYSNQIGYALANTADKNLIQLTVLAARAAATVTGGFGGSTLTNAGYDTTADVLVQGIIDAAQALDEKDIPARDRHVVLKPKHYNLLVQSSKATNRDYVEGNGSIASGKVFAISDVLIHKSNHVPSTVISADALENNTYSGTFTNTIGVVFHKSATATVKLLDLGVESQYDIRRQGTLMLAKYAMGHGILRPESAVELLKA